MPSFYFDVRTTNSTHGDDHGSEHANLDEAITEAQALLPGLISEELPDGDWHHVSCDVRDEAGRTVYRAELAYRGRRL